MTVLETQDLTKRFGSFVAVDRLSIHVDTTMDNVFAHYAEGAIESGGGYRDTVTARQTARRLG